MYESGMGAMIDAAMRLEEDLDVPIIEPVDPFEYKSDNRSGEFEIRGADRRTNSIILNHLLDIGYSVTPVTKSPFEALSRDKDMIIVTSLDNDRESVQRKALVASDISRISGAPSVIIVENKRGLDGLRFTAVVTKDEVSKIDDKSELTDMVMNRSKVE
jgi:putative transcriptional regulator